tara:strand:- start:146 stop:499 length:354 start_codon:yes stop_codon:yes gene_type:complete
MIKDGQNKTYYEDGELCSIENYKDGIQDGLFYYYHKGGFLKQKGFYKNGKLYDAIEYHCTSDLFKEMQQHSIPAKKQINFVISIYAYFKYYDYHLQDNDKSKFKRVEKQRERALKDS